MKRLTSLVFASYIFTLIAGGATVALAADPYGLDATAGQTPFAAQTKTKKSVPQLVGSFLSVALSLIGVIFLCLAVYGGFQWMTAGGDPKKVGQGRDTLVNATIGIVLIVAAYTITNFIFTDVISKVAQ